MTIRYPSLLATAALAATSVPAFAQDGRYDLGLPPPLPELGDAEWDAEWDEYLEERDESVGGAWQDPAQSHDRAPDGHGSTLPPLSPGPSIGYSDAQRELWLAQCREAYFDARGRRRGEAIGGVLGAVAGGVAGNRIADGERFAGTLIGAGVGGLAGAAVGSAVGAAADRDRIERRFDACEDYLLRYERSFGAHGAVNGAYRYGYGYPHAPVMWVKVPIVSHRKGDDCECETVVEDWVEEVAPAPAPPAKRVKIRPSAAPDKRIRLNK